MGKIACSLSDKVIFTSDNPRSEDPIVIIDQMKSGVKNKDKHKFILEINLGWKSNNGVITSSTLPAPMMT